ISPTVFAMTSPPGSIAIAAFLLLLGNVTLWWVADGFRRATASADLSSRQERRLAAAVAQAADMIIVEDADGRMEYVNPAFGQLTGFSLADTSGKTVASLVRSGEHDADFYRDLDESIRAGVPWSGRITGRRRDGSPIVQALKVSPLHDAEGRLA